MSKSFFQKCTRNVLAWLLVMFMPLCAFAGTSRTGDAGEKYDGRYDRPTHFPTFTQPTAWAGTMSYFVYVRDNAGNPISNYEVAVYDQDGLLRHVSRSISSQGELCTLTIPGQSGHTFTFQVIYGDFDSPTIVDAEESVKFKANNIVGGPLSPFWLTIPVPEIPGDVNRDGTVTIADVAALVALLIQPGATFPVTADVNNDTHVNLEDVYALERLILEIK